MYFPKNSTDGRVLVPRKQCPSGTGHHPPTNRSISGYASLGLPRIRNGHISEADPITQSKLCHSPHDMPVSQRQGVGTKRFYLKSQQTEKMED